MRDVLAWLEETARRRATSTGTVPGGFVVRNHDYPAAHDHNRLFITSEVDPDALATAADEALADASHRLIYVHDLDVAAAVAARLIELDYERSDELIMTAGAVEPRHDGDQAAPNIVDLDVDERVAVATEEWRADQSEGVARQLGARIRTVVPAADTTFLAVRGDDGTVVAHVDLYVRDGLAQVEELMTAPAVRGRGLGSALVVEAVQRAGANRAFIVADVDDWPKQMYRRLGFSDLGTTATFSRSWTTYFAPWAWLPDGVHRDVRITVEDGRFTAVEPNAGASNSVTADDVRLPGVILPGLANTHSHAFHRALRGRTHAGGGSFWTWREAMYAVAEVLEPDSYFRLARAVFAEMVLAGVTCVGEFHYVHHRRDGRPYEDPNAMGHAVIEAARAAGLRITLLDTCYLAGGLGADGPMPLNERQRRFGDTDARAWAGRFAHLEDADGARIGAAVHSVRAVPRDQIPTVAAAAAGRPLHVHLSEQPAENEQCRAAYGLSPTQVLAQAGALGTRTTAVHATHLDDDDIAALGNAHTSISLCPTTERDLADGIGPGRRLLDRGAPLTFGSDQNAVVDLFEEARGAEMDERLATNERGRFTPAELMTALSAAGHRALGWDDAGRIEPGMRADLVAVRLDTVRTAGARAEQVVLAATAADIDTVIVDGHVVVRDGRHLGLDVAAELAAAIDAVSTVSP